MTGSRQKGKASTSGADAAAGGESTQSGFPSHAPQQPPVTVQVEERNPTQEANSNKCAVLSSCANACLTCLGTCGGLCDDSDNEDNTPPGRPSSLDDMSEQDISNFLTQEGPGVLADVRIALENVPR
jgi:hypothetical protein